jgi:catechol 2,3-dioxygenase-like lactoylglutathione lyase family enzyme
MTIVPIVRLDHVQLAMPAGREADAVAFYEGILGIAHVPKPAHLAARGGCWFEDGDLKVHLGVEQDFRPATKAHPAFIVDDVGHLARAVAAAGFGVRDDEPLEGYDRVYVDDPFGNRIELMQPRARATAPFGPVVVSNAEPRSGHQHVRVSRPRHQPAGVSPQAPA